jgi:phosphoribosylaminoimidazole-succinocarboxamide synthase
MDRSRIRRALGWTIDETTLPALGDPVRGKVRDSYVRGDRRILVTTDRISAFDRVLGTIPYKGAVLNLISRFWFDRTADRVPNHVIDVPHPNVLVARNCTPLPVEMVVRAYITGVTSTSLWTHYSRGERVIAGNRLPDGLEKNQKLDRPILTPSTKAEHGDHDETVSREEILERGAVDEETFDRIAEMSFTLFEIGASWASRQGLILVDTKYEFGRTDDGRIVVIDEVHTPDSSRYWMAGSYEERLARGEEPQGLDKEYVRRWLKEERSYVGDGPVPPIPDEVRVEAASRYIAVYELITGLAFDPGEDSPLEKLEAWAGDFTSGG